VSAVWLLDQVHHTSTKATLRADVSTVWACLVVAMAPSMRVNSKTATSLVAVSADMIYLLGDSVFLHHEPPPHLWLVLLLFHVCVLFSVARNFAN